MSAGLLTLAALVSAVLCIGFDYSGRRRGVYVFKPATMVFILGLAFVLTPVVSPEYRFWIVAGLAFSLVGDIMLMLPRDRFLHGLAAFLAAHWCFVAAFAPVWPDARLVYLLPWLLAGSILFGVFRPAGASTRLAVIAYLFSILVMVWLALEHWRVAGPAALPGPALAATGAVLFVVSDTLIGFCRFRANRRWVWVAILGTYFPAQWLLALSVAAPGALPVATG